MTYRFSLTDKVDLSNGCNKISGNLIEQGNLTIFTVSNGTRGNYTVYNENPATSNGGSGSESGKVEIDFDGKPAFECEPSLLGPNTQNWLNWLFRTIQIAGPIIALLLSMIDFVNAVISSEDGAMKKAWGKFIRRMIAAVLLIILPVIIELILEVTNVISSEECKIK